VGLDEALARVRAVTAEQVTDLAAELLSGPRCLTVVGPFDPDREFVGFEGVEPTPDPYGEFDDEATSLGA
jgi:hypothetical protein